MQGFARPCLLAIGVVVVACGGSEEKGLFGAGSGGGGAAGSSVGGATSGGSGGQAGSASGGAQQGGAPSGGAGGTGGSVAGGGATNTGGSGGGSGGTSATGGKGGSGGSPGGGGAGAGNGVGTGPCGAISCAFSAGDACCKADNVGLYCSNEALANHCTCKGIGCNTTEIKCDGPEDCSTGKICCAEKGLISSTWDLVECRETCKSDQIVGSTRREVCHPGGKACANGTACVKDTWLPPEYSTCGP